MRVFLIGFMGCGKSTIGKALAKQMGFDFIDLDKYIEKKEVKSIQQIFKKKGELAFRKIEGIALLEVCKKNNIVIATGGGTPCFLKNMQTILEKGRSIYLKMEAEELKERLVNQQTQRPLLNNKSEKELFDFINSTLLEREGFYNQADFIVEGENISSESVLKLLT
jgi:shikimate kinase